MVQPNELPAVLQQLDASGIAYAVSGGLASSTWGQPRATYDADILVDLKAQDVQRLLAIFPPPHWYLDRDAVLEAIHGGGEFNAIHGESGTKLDFWVRSRRAYEAARFSRRRRELLAGVECWLLSPEDTILAKLEWTKDAPSQRQSADIAGIFAVQAANLDLDYLRDWADRLGVRRELDSFLSQS